MTSREIVDELNSLATKMIVFEAAIASARTTIEHEIAKSTDPWMPPLPMMSVETDPELKFGKVECPTERMSLGQQRKWLADIQAALVAADRKFRKLADAGSFANTAKGT